jgi:hypothetical protein
MPDDPAAAAEPTAVAEPAEPAGVEGKSEAELALIKESQKYRGRAQEAEKELAELQDANKKAELDRLEEEGKIKEKNVLLTTDNEALKTKAGEWDSYKESRKQELLETLPEDKRESYKGFSLEQLEIVAKDLKTQPKVEVNTQTPGSLNMTDTEKAIQELTQQFSESKITHPQYQAGLAKLRAN